MATVQQIVTRAYRKLGVAAVDETLSADEIAVGVDALNMMLHSWLLSSVDTGHTDVDPSDTFPLDPEFHEGVVYLLAARISSDYMVPQSFDADDWFRKIQAAYMTIAPVEMPNGLLKLPSQYARQKVARGGFGVG
jgi:hypothetical protein